MATEKPKPKSTLQRFDCVMKPVPPGRKARGRLWRPGDPESAARRWWLVGVAVTGALVAGVLIGRLVMP